MTVGTLCDNHLVGDQQLNRMTVSREHDYDLEHARVCVCVCVVINVSMSAANLHQNREVADNVLPASAGSAVPEVWRSTSAPTP